jgi:hypothetical protein
MEPIKSERAKKGSRTVLKQQLIAHLHGRLFKLPVPLLLQRHHLEHPEGQDGYHNRGDDADDPFEDLLALPSEYFIVESVVNYDEDDGKDEGEEKPEPSAEPHYRTQKRVFGGRQKGKRVFRGRHRENCVPNFCGSESSNTMKDERGRLSPKPSHTAEKARSFSKN